MKSTLNHSIIILLLFSFISLSSMKCKKDELGLPPATQTGANTVGFLLNGQPWTPKGQVGMSANLSLEIDFGYNDGLFGIRAYRYDSTTKNKESFNIGMRDSLNYYSAPFSLSLTNKSLAKFYVSNSSYTFFSNDPGVYAIGGITVSKLDKINRIIAGTFNATLHKPGCADTIKITDGRFDMKF